MLEAAGWPINRFDFGAKAHNDSVYVSRGAEIWDNLSMRVKKAEIVLINDPVLISQLTTRKILYDARGRFKLEPKEDMQARGLKSPDRADAVVGAFAHGMPTFSSWAKRADTPFEALERYYEGLPQDDLDSDKGSEKIQKEIGGFPGY
jgi:hypothetical protein